MASRAKKKKILEAEVQDAQAISRKKWKFTFSPQLFFIIKLVLIVLIPIVYFVYSPLLIFVMLAYVGLFFLARLAERELNKSVIKSNHIHISKFDSAIALIIVIIALVGSIMSATGKNKKSAFENMPNSEISQKFNNSRFEEMKKKQQWNEFLSGLKNFGSLLTGERNVFEEEKEFNFTSMKPPKDFVANKDDLPKDFDFPSGDRLDFNPAQFGAPPGNFKFSMDDIPVSYVSSSMLSTVNTVLVFSVAGFGLLSLILVKRKQMKFETEMNEVVIEEKITMLSNEELERILSFGEDVEEKEAVIVEYKETENTTEETSQEEFVDAPEKLEDENIEILNDNFEFKD